MSGCCLLLQIGAFTNDALQKHALSIMTELQVCYKIKYSVNYFKTDFIYVHKLLKKIMEFDIYERF